MLMLLAPLLIDAAVADGVHACNLRHAMGPDAASFCIAADLMPHEIVSLELRCVNALVLLQFCACTIMVHSS